MPYLFDGYNVYHAAIKLVPEAAHITPLMLCQVVVEDMQRLGEGAEVVFDGRKGPGEWDKLEAGGVVKVIFSGCRSDADTELEKLIKKNSAPRRLTVVSSDRRVQRAGRRRRCKILSAADYLEEMLRRQERPAIRPSEPSEKRRGVEGEQLNEWLEIFGIEVKETTDDTDRIKF